MDTSGKRKTTNTRPIASQKARKRNRRKATPEPQEPTDLKESQRNMRRYLLRVRKYLYLVYAA